MDLGAICTLGYNTNGDDICNMVVNGKVLSILLEGYAWSLVNVGSGEPWIFIFWYLLAKI